MTSLQAVGGDTQRVSAAESLRCRAVGLGVGGSAARLADLSAAARLHVNCQSAEGPLPRLRDQLGVGGPRLSSLCLIRCLCSAAPGGEARLTSKQPAAPSWPAPSSPSLSSSPPPWPPHAPHPRAMWLVCILSLLRLSLGFWLVPCRCLWVLCWLRSVCAWESEAMAVQLVPDSALSLLMVSLGSGVRGCGWGCVSCLWPAAAARAADAWKAALFLLQLFGNGSVGAGDQP